MKCTQQTLRHAVEFKNIYYITQNACGLNLVFPHSDSDPWPPQPLTSDQWVTLIVKVEDNSNSTNVVSETWGDVESGHFDLCCPFKSLVLICLYTVTSWLLKFNVLKFKARNRCQAAALLLTKPGRQDVFTSLHKSPDSFRVDFTIFYHLLFHINLPQRFIHTWYLASIMHLNQNTNLILFICSFWKSDMELF